MHQVSESVHNTVPTHPQRMPSHTYIVRAHGDGMTGAGIHHNDLLLVDRSELATAGDIVVAELNGEALIRRLAIIEGAFVLLPASDCFPSIKVREGDELTIWGVVRRRLPVESAGW
ncbi:LexA family protein [Pseudomonas sp. MT3]|uniref:LexA family protein n=1 Tax=Pseudomonas sp. ATCC 13867 TaxID=1294143 RepID=UPI0002C4EC7F|nr:S24 family peptidase [Pseudomonas sp. ATCC 13867]AGI24572.1 peptidase S24 and S26 domain-containing protein [Pseudomonas sp. ATCC 13867]RFQ18766.1 S24 family peptidase [Pseudomonas sp. ATCC 13867]